MVRTQHFPAYFLLCFFSITSSIKASVGAIDVCALPGYEPQFERALIERQPTVEELFEAGAYERAMELFDPTQGNPRRFIVKVLRTKKADLVRAYAEKACPYRADLWDGLFCCLATLPMCQALWPLRHFEPDQELPIKKLVEMMIRAACEGDLPSLRWGIHVMKELNCLHELNPAKGGASYSYERPGTLDKARKERMLYASPLIAAADNNQRKMVSLLLMHGADPMHTGFRGASRAECCASWRGYKDIAGLLESYSSLRPLILEFMKNPLAGNSDDQQKVYQALRQRPEFASEHVTGQRSDTLLHAAVIAENPQLIGLCLIYNRRLLDAERSDGFTPVRLAAGGFHGALQLLLKLCYTNRNKPEV